MRMAVAAVVAGTPAGGRGAQRRGSGAALNVRVPSSHPRVPEPYLRSASGWLSGEVAPSTVVTVAVKFAAPAASAASTT